VSRHVALGFLLLASLLVGVAYQPDVGTAADLHSAGLTDPIVGTNHAKPLPRIPTASDVVRVTVLTSFLLLVLASLCLAATMRVTRRDERRSSLLWSRVNARRGPPPAPTRG
jgi:hypothetical protein